MMNSFRGGQIHRPVSQAFLQSARMLGECKGRQTLYVEQTPQLLEALRQTAIVQSTESSNRIEGVVASLARIQELVAQKTTPRDRSEQEIAGYRDVLQTIHASYRHIPLSPSVVLQFHGALYRYSATEGGRWKSGDNEIVERHADGTRVVRFRPTPAWATPLALDELHADFKAAWEGGKASRFC